MDQTKSGIFSRGTMGKTATSNMYDAAATTFSALPDGPYETSTIHNQQTAQPHFKGQREIGLRRGANSKPVTSYTDHYPPKEAPMEGEGLDLSGAPVPFTSRTEYNDEFYKKPSGRPKGADDFMNSTVPTYKPNPWLAMGTTNQHFHRPFDVEYDGPDDNARPATVPCAVDPYNTTYRVQYTPKKGDGRIRPGEKDPKDPLPWLNDGTTYRNHYIPHPLAVVDPSKVQLFPPLPFDSTTEYRAEYTPKEREELLPPLTGTISKAGLQLPIPRKSLGCQFWYLDNPDKYYVLIPRTLEVPCAARQVFSTIHDDQETACILVLYGDDPIASNNMLLGQFDLVNIPPAPMGVPQIEVTYRLDRDCYLTAEAKDLDTLRHKLWIQRGEVIVLRK